MAQKQRPQAETLYGSPQPNYIGYATAPIISRRDPTSSDTGYPLGQVWVNKVDSSSWILTSVSAGVAVWQSSAGEGLYPITPYVVGPEGEGGYQTIQSALDAIVLSGGSGAIYIQPGTYTEDLIYNGVNSISLTGLANVKIIGTHLLSASVKTTHNNIYFQSAGDLFTSLAPVILGEQICNDCQFNINGYIYNIPQSIAGTSVSLNRCQDADSTQNNIMNNAGGSAINILDCYFIAGGGNFTVLGVANFQNSTFGSQLIFSENLSTVNNCTFALPITFSSGSEGIFEGCQFNAPVAGPAIVCNSGLDVIQIYNSTINCPDSPAIGGTGRIKYSNLSFLNNSDIAGTLTLTYGTSRSGPTLINGNLSLAQAATQLQIEGGAVTDFIGTGTLASGTVTIANTNIAATDRILLQRIASNGSTTLGELGYSISAGASFTVTSLILGTPGSTQTGDTSTFFYFIIRQL